MSTPNIVDIQRVTLNAVQRIHDFCQANELRYYLIGGGLIGAVRHGGPIPWDDDIDIGMPRRDYEIFLKLSDAIGSPYLVSTLDSDPSYIYGFAKCYDSNTTVTEDLAIRFTRGVWVDIFPIDGTFDNAILRKLHLAVSRGLKAVLASRCGAYIRHKQTRRNMILRRAASIGSSPLPLRALHSLLHAVLAIRGFEKSTYAANLLGRWGSREICRTAIFDRQVEVQFAEHSFMIPIGHHEYLTGVYGDYMQLPDEDLRTPDHSTAEISLNQPFFCALENSSAKSK